MKNRRGASQTKWYRDCDLNEEEIDWKKPFNWREHAQKVSKLLFFNLNFSKDNDICTFCKEETDTLLHLFWQCKVTSHFWGTFFQWLQSSSSIQKGNHLAMTTALGLKPVRSNTKLQINFPCLISTHYIWTCNLRDEIPNLSQFLRLLKKTYEIETNGNLSWTTCKG